MHLTPREHERLLLAAAADLARRRLARGAPLGATEAVALVCDEVCELAWDGLPLDEVIARARAVIPPAALLPGVAGLVPVIEVEALFPWGSTLVHVDAPFSDDHEPGQSERGRLAPVAPRSPAPGSGDAAGPPPDDGSGRGGTAARDAGPPGGAGSAASGPPDAPGAILARAGVIELAAGAARRAALLRNTGPRDVWISSHFPLSEVNPAIRLRWAAEAGEAGEAEAAPGDDVAPGPRAATRDDAHGPRATGDDAHDPRAAASATAAPHGLRLDLPAGEALLLRAGEERQVTVVVTSA